jgi:hypothetical protein
LKPKAYASKVGKNIKSENSEHTPYKFEYPVFSFKEIKRGYEVDECNNEEKSSLASKLARIGIHSWIELHNADRHGIGCEKIAKTAIRTRTDFLQPDVTLLAFRFYGLAPMIGYRCSVGVFHILWLDRKRKLYKHG